MNDDDVARRSAAPKRVRHRVLPPRAAGDDAQRLRRRRAGTAGGSPTSSAGSATTISSIAGCARNAATLRSSIGRPPTASSCFGTRAAEPLAASAGRDDRCDVHGDGRL